MREKAKNPSKSLRSRAVSAAKLTLAGVLMLALMGLIGAVAVSVARRYRAPEDALAKYPKSRQHEAMWYEGETKPKKISDFKVTQRHFLDDMNAVQLIFTWRVDLHWHCAGSLLMREMQDIFGGWEELRYSGGGCSSGSGGSGGGGSAAYDAWESPFWEFPRYYYFAYIGTTPDNETIEFVFSDGTRASAESVDDSVGLVIRRNAPFYIDKVNYLDDSGEVLYSSPEH